MIRMSVIIVVVIVVVLVVMSMAMVAVVLVVVIMIVSYHIIYHLFSFRGSLEDYKIHMDMEIAIFAAEVKKWSQYKSVQQF